MSYYSDFKYGRSRDKWFEAVNFYRWFKDSRGPILDIGCAAGNFIALDPEIIEGIDIDEDDLKIAQGKGYKVSKINADTEMRMLKSDSYNGVWAKQLLEHLNNPLDFLKEIKRILKPGGRAVLYTPNCPYLLNRSFWNDYTHKRPFTRFTLNMVAYDAGFRKIEIYEDFRCFPGLGRLMRLFHLSPAMVAKIQRLFFIRGLSLILVLEK
jgi:SAM-dependent methyltransferase